MVKNIIGNRKVTDGEGVKESIIIKKMINFFCDIKQIFFISTIIFLKYLALFQNFYCPSISRQ
jgi:hypothetical protein